MLYNRCTGIYKFGNNIYHRRIRRRSNLGHIFRGGGGVLWAGKDGMLNYNLTLQGTSGVLCQPLHRMQFANHFCTILCSA